jgi:hypothetical protein
MMATEANGNFICNLVNNQIANPTPKFYKSRLVNNTDAPQTVTIAPYDWGGGSLSWNLSVGVEP